MLAGNSAYAVLWRRTLAAPEGERNVLWQSFVLPECCGPYATGPRRSCETSSPPCGPRPTPASTDLSPGSATSSAEFARMWAAHDVAPPGSRVKLYRHASAGNLRMTVTDLELAATPGLRMVVYAPADETSRARLD